MFKTKIQRLLHKIRNIVNDCDKSFIKRLNINNPNQLNMKDILYFSTRYLDSSYSIANGNLFIDSHKNVSNQALNKRRFGMDLSIFDKINESILDIIYEPHKNIKTSKSRIIAVDGSQINLDKALEKYEYRLSANKKYCTAKLGSLFDVNRKIPINYLISSKTNERDILIDQLKYVNKNDTLVMDRGYYSHDLLNILFENDINFVFRMPISNLLVKNYVGNNNIINIPFEDGRSVKCKIVKYIIKKKPVYLLTNLINKNINTLKNNYWSRWYVETDFRKVKYDILYNGIRSKSDKQIKIDIAVINFVGLLVGYIETFGKPVPTKKINSKNAIEKTLTRLMNLFLYAELNKYNLDNIYKILSLIINTVELIRKYREHERIRVKPSSKWNVYGNRYGPG